MNKQHKNIQFTFENEINDEIPFLDVIVKRKDHHFYTSQYFKRPTHDWLYLTPMIKNTMMGWWRPFLTELGNLAKTIL